MDIFLAISNLLFLLPAIKAIQLHRWTRSIIYFLIVFVSGTYHLCDSSIMVCVLNKSIHHDMDFFFSQLLIPLTALYFIYFEYPFIERWLIILFAVAIYLIQVLTDSTQMIVQVTLLSISIGIVVLFLIYYRIRYKHLPSYHVLNLVLGLLFTIIGFVFFIYGTSMYWVLHSLWHIFAAIGQFFILKIKDVAPLYANLDSKIITRLKTYSKYDDTNWIQKVFLNKKQLNDFIDNGMDHSLYKKVCYQIHKEPDIVNKLGV